MRKLVATYLLAVLLPSLLLAALAIRAQGDQEVVLRQQRALVHQATVDALATEAASFLEAEQQAFAAAVDALLDGGPSAPLAGRFTSALPGRWPTPCTPFTLSPTRGLGSLDDALPLEENRVFLEGAESAWVYNAVRPDTPKPVESTREASEAFDIFRRSNEKTQAQPTRGLSLFRSKKGRVAGVETSAARPEEDSFQDGYAPEEDVITQTRLRLTVPQTLAAAAPTESAAAARTTEFAQVVAEVPSGVVARFVGGTLYLIFYHRPGGSEHTFGAVVDPGYLREALAGLVDIVTGAPEEACIALLDAEAEPVATSIAGFAPPGDSWRRPFVAAEIGALLPRWEVTAYFTDPGAIARGASAAKLRTALGIAAVLAAITGGGVFIALAFRRQIAEARQKTDFVSNVSHELKTPLTSIRMFSDLLASPQAADSAKRERYAGVIQAEAARLGRLINNVLDFSRLERGGASYRTDEIDPLRLLRETLAHFQPGLEAAGFTVETDLPRSLPAIAGDADALSQVLVNLLSNAEKYSPETKEVRVAARASGTGVTITIADRGQGVPAGWDEKIFRQFTRVDDSLAAAVPGSGLGLALSRSIARANGGDITYRPNPGGGSIFEIVLPLS